MRDAAIDPLRQSGRGGARVRSSGAPSLDGMVDERPAPRGSKTGAARVGGVMTSAAIAAQRLGGRRGGPSVARGRSTPGALARLRGRLPRIRPFKALTVGVFSVALVGIVANAMVFQRGRHPAPLFGLGHSVEGAPDPAQQAAASPPPAPVPVEPTGTIAPPAAPVPAAPPAAAAAPASAPRHAAAKRREDGIGGLIKAVAPSAAAHPRPGRPASRPATADAAATHPRPAARPEAKPDVKPRPEHRARAEATAAADARPAPRKAADAR